MSNIRNFAIDTTIFTINNSSTLIINGEEYKIKLEKVTKKKTFLLSEILAFEPNANIIGKDIEAYDSYFSGSKKYKKFLFLIASLYICLVSKTKEEEKKAKQSMFSFFNVDDVNAFTSTVKEFRNFHEKKNLLNVSKQVEDIYNTYYSFNVLMLYKIIEFAYYNPVDFEMKIDVSNDYNFLNIKEEPENVQF